MERVSITHFTNAHNVWLQSLDFYKEEVIILKGRLTEIAGKNSSADVMKQVEHFENQFKLQMDNMEVLSHDIHANVSRTGQELQHSKEGYVDQGLLVDHDKLKERFIAEEKVFNELRHEFNQFAASWM